MTTFFWKAAKPKTIAQLTEDKIKETELDLFKVMLDKETAIAWETALFDRLERLKRQQAEMRTQL